MLLDGDLAGVPAAIGPLDASWQVPAEEVLQVGRRITEGRVAPSSAATGNPETWAFLTSLNPGDLLIGTVAAIQRFGVFVALDDGPLHPTYPGVGFISVPDLSWRRVEAFSDVVQVGERITCSFLCMDGTNGEARIRSRTSSPIRGRIPRRSRERPALRRQGHQGGGVEGLCSRRHMRSATGSWSEPPGSSPTDAAYSSPARAR